MAETKIATFHKSQNPRLLDAVADGQKQSFVSVLIYAIKWFTSLYATFYHASFIGSTVIYSATLTTKTKSLPTRKALKETEKTVIISPFFCAFSTNCQKYLFCAEHALHATPQNNRNLFWLIVPW